jgi:hypothetical protein
VGRTREAAAIMDSVEAAWTPRTYAIATDIARYYALAGDGAVAARWYERSRGIYTWVIRSQAFDPVRDAPEFHQALARMEARHRAEFDAARWRRPLGRTSTSGQ